jgi:hypothetical protein
MRYRVVGLAGAALALITACDQGPSIAGPQMSPSTLHPSAVIQSKTNEMDVEWLDEVQNCDNEPVFVNGTTHVILTETVDDAGGFHRSWRFISKGSGVNVTNPLVLYRIDEQTGEMQDEKYPQSTFTHEERLLVNAPKSEDNFIYHLIVKVVFPASTDPGDPQPSVMFDRSYAKCVG